MNATERVKEITGLAQKLLQLYPGGCNVGQLVELAGQDKASDVLAMAQYIIEKQKLKTGCSDSRGCGCSRCRDLYGQ